MGCKHSSIVTLGSRPGASEQEKQAFFIADNTRNIKKKQKRKKRKRCHRTNPDDIPLQKISVSTVGGISFDVWIEDSQTNMTRGSCPAHLSRKAEMDDTAKDLAGAKIDEKLERAKDRRDQKIKAMREKFEIKRKATEARIKKLQEEKEQHLDRLKDAILQK